VQIPEPGQVIRTKKMSMEGKVERLGQNRAGYEEVFFRTADGRLMKTPLDNVIVIEKLEDEDDEIMEDAAGLLAQYKKIISESRFEYDKKSGGMKQNNEDPDQRHGLYIDGKLVKTLSTKDQAENTKKRDPRFNSAEIRKIAEGGMGGINRCAPAQDVSHEHDLEDVYDKWKGDTVKVKEAGPYAHLFDKMVEASFTDILNRQHAEKPKPRQEQPIDIKYHSWTIRYRPPKKPGRAVPWQVMDRNNEIKKSGEAANEKEAVAAAQDWVNAGGDATNQQSTKSVTIDFNVDFAKEFGMQFYATITNDNSMPALLISLEPQPELKKSHIRTQKEKQKEGTTNLPCISLSAKESNDAGLRANGRYALGGNQNPGEDIMIYPLIFQSTVLDKGDRHKLGEPGLTVATSREMEEGVVNEISKSTLGSYIKKASADVADRSNMAGWKAGTQNSKYNTSDESPKETQRHAGIGRAVDKLSKSKQMPKSMNSRDDVEDVDYRDA
jgi:hypothetical protein